MCKGCFKEVSDEVIGLRVGVESWRTLDPYVFKGPGPPLSSALLLVGLGPLMSQEPVAVVVFFIDLYPRIGCVSQRP